METLVHVLSDKRLEVIFAGGDRIFFHLRKPIKIEILVNSNTVIDLVNLKSKLEEFYNYDFRNSDLTRENFNQLVERISRDMKQFDSLKKVNKIFKRKRVWYYQHNGEDIQKIQKYIDRTWMYNTPLGYKEMDIENKYRLCGSLEEAKKELVKYEGTVVWSELELCNPRNLFGAHKNKNSVK